MKVNVDTSGGLCCLCWSDLLSSRECDALVVETPFSSLTMTETVSHFFHEIDLYQTVHCRHVRERMTL